MTRVIDVHTHHLPADNPDKAILSISVAEPLCTGRARYMSVGIHPWHVKADKTGAADPGADKLYSQLEQLRGMARRADVVAIGEAGIDYLCPTPLPLQKELFISQIKLAEELGLPLMIHAVRSHADIVALHKKFRPSVPWIVHGFRGNQKLAAQYISKEIYLSLGQYHNADTLALLAQSERLLMETDESSVSIEEIYKSAAEKLGVAAGQLEAMAAQNVERLFFDK